MKKYFDILSVGIVWFVTLMVNFSHFLMGHSANVFNVIATILYIVVIMWVCLQSVEKKTRLFLLAWSGATLIIAMISFIVAFYGLSFDALIPFAIVFLTSFYGLTFMSENFVVWYSLIIGMSMLWIISCLYVDKKRCKGKV